MRVNRSIVTGACLLSLGCAAVVVPETNDPREKLTWAAELFDRQARPLPAERLIVEAISICTRTGDHECQARAYVTYGFFFRSPSLRKWETSYRKDGFLDSTATYDTRYVKSKEYFERSIPLFEELKQFDALTNAHLNLGLAHEFLDDKAGACEPYAMSLRSHEKNRELNPTAKVAVAKGSGTYPDYVAIQQRRAGCIP